MTPPILYPMFAMVALTFIVLLTTAAYRINLIRRRQVSLGYYRTFAGDVKLPQRFDQFTNNFNNLTQMPVLFYAVCAVNLALAINDSTCVMLAWLFVALRAVHSFVHMTYNNVNHRFGVFVLSNISLLALWLTTLSLA